MLVFRIKGRLGNQMFIYAFGRVLGKEFPGTSVLFDHYGDLRNFRLSTRDARMVHLAGKMRERFMRYTLRNLRTHDFDDCRVSYPVNEIASLKNAIINGYFQDASYYSGHEEMIRSFFTPVPELEERFRTATAGYFGGKRVIAVHLRRTDYATNGYPYEFLNGPDLTLPESYYRKALQRLDAGPDDRIIFMSDEPAFAKKVFADLPNAIFSGHDAMTDLQIMMHADACVIANSTFSWWGAWLNSKPGLVVITPEYFLGFKAKKEFPHGITPSNWIKIQAA